VGGYLLQREGVCHGCQAVGDGGILTSITLGWEGRDGDSGSALGEEVRKRSGRRKKKKYKDERRSSCGLKAVSDRRLRS